MTSEHIPTLHVVPLRSFPALARAIVQLPRTPGCNPDGAVRSSPLAGAECVQCGMRIAGEALIALSAPPPDEGHDPRVERLRQGYCARKGCDSYFYRVSFRPHPGVDWASLIALSTGEKPIEVRKEDVVTPDHPLARRQLMRLVAWRGGLGLGALAAIWFGRHWHRGGRIPLIREPEQFEVDVLTAEQREALEGWRAYRPR